MNMTFFNISRTNSKINKVNQQSELNLGGREKKIKSSKNNQLTGHFQSFLTSSKTSKVSQQSVFNL